MSGLTVEKIMTAKEMLERNNFFEPPKEWTAKFDAMMYEHMLNQLYPLMTVPATFLTPNKEKPVSDAVKRADQVKSDVARLEGEVARLNDMVKMRQSTIDRMQQEKAANDQRALLVYRDGRTKNMPLSVEPDSSHRGYRPVRWFYETEAPMYQFDQLYSAPISTTIYKRTFYCVTEQALDAKTIVYVER